MDKSAAFLRQSRTALEQIKAEGTYDVIDDIGRQNALARQISADRQKMGCTAPAPLVDVGNPDEVLEGHYYLSGVMETGSELLLKANGQFEWFISYGAVDQMAKGRWGRSGNTVTLAVDPHAKEQPLFRADVVFPWDEAAERFRWEQERDRQEDLIAARCPWNRSSTETPWSFDLEESPPPDDAQRERANNTRIAAEAARDEASRIVASALAANASDADRAAANGAMEAWYKAKDDMAQAHYVANLLEPDIGEPAKPPACQPLPVANYVPIPEAEWQRGVAVMVGDPERDFRLHGVTVTFVFSDGHRETADTRTRGIAFAPTRAGATVDQLVLELHEPVARSETVQIQPMTDGIQAVIVDTQQISEPAFEVLRLQVEAGDLVPENMPRGRYTISPMDTDPPAVISAELLVTPPAQGETHETSASGETQLSDVPRLEFDRPIHETLGSDAPCSASSSYADCYRIEGKRGQKIALALSSDAFDALLELGGPDGFYKQNDDGPGEGTDSMLAATLPADGTYYAGVSSYKGRKKGAYVLTLSEGSSDIASAEPPPPFASVPPASDEQELLASGGSATGTMGEDEAIRESMFQGEAGQRLHIILKADGTPAKFELIAPDDHRWRSDYQIDRMDEREALVVTLPLSGEYRILHYGETYRPGEAFKLSIEEAPETTPCQFRGNIKDRPPRRFVSGGTLSLGADVCGNITPSDPLVAGRHADTYDISLTAQAEIDVLLRGFGWNLPWAAEGEITGPQGFRRSLPLEESPPTLVVPVTGLYKIQVFTAPQSAVHYGDYELVVRPGGGPSTTNEAP